MSFYEAKVKPLFSNLRFYVLMAGLLLSAGVYLWARMHFADSTIRIIRLEQIFALLAITHLYFALLASPLTRTFKSFPGREHYLRARRAIGVLSFYFAALHASLAFFGLLGGFAGLGFLEGRYILAITFSSMRGTIVVQ